MTGNAISRIKHLDGLRGVAITSVVLFHAYVRWAAAIPYSTSSLARTSFSFGWLGVELFFAISGFVIFSTLDRCPTLGEFALRRWLRLFPGMLMASAFLLVASYFLYRPEGPVTLVNAIPGLVFAGPEFWARLIGIEIKSLDGAFWSIYVEVAFYLVSGFSYFIFKDRYGLTVLVLFFAYLAFRFLTGHFGGGGFPGLVDKTLKDVGIENYAWFLVGIFFYRHWKGELRFGFLFSIGAGLLGALVILGNKGPASAIGSIIVLALFVSSFKLEAFAALLRNRIVLWIGFVSYPLYLIHQNFVVGGAVGLFRLVPWIPSILLPVPAILIVAIIAYGIAKIEPHLKRRLGAAS